MRASRAGAAIVVLLAAAGSGCGASRPVPQRSPTTDKDELYGDAALVPTREGERARRELALAGQIQNLVAALPFARTTEVDVQVPVVGPTRVTVVVGLHAGDGRPHAPTVESLARSVAGPDAQVQVQLAADEAPAPARSTWPLVVALLGLGISLGVTAERLRQGGARAGRSRRER